jgi:hypothetical protein
MYALRRALVVLISAFFMQSTVTHAQTKINPEKWQAFDAYRLSDGRSEAVVVPALSGRVMWFGLKGRFNFLWNAPTEIIGGGGFKNWGGDKTFVGPHEAWEQFAAALWPPQPGWDGPAHEAEIAGDKLRVSGPLWPGFGTRINRAFSFNDKGEFVIEQMLEKTEGETVRVAAWQVTQCVTPDAVFFRINPESQYKNGVFWFGRPHSEVDATPVSPSLFRIRPQPGRGYKIGADSPQPAIAAVKDGIAFVQRAPREKGPYPDGASEAGFPVEFYNHGEPGTKHYVELELLSPLRYLRSGDTLRFTARWSLHGLPSQFPAQRETLDSIQALVAGTK